MVLILVLVEDGLEVTMGVDYWGCAEPCLNPCFSGRWS